MMPVIITASKDVLKAIQEILIKEEVYGWDMHLKLKDVSVQIKKQLAESKDLVCPLLKKD